MMLQDYEQLLQESISKYMRDRDAQVKGWREMEYNRPIHSSEEYNPDD